MTKHAGRSAPRVRPSGSFVLRTPLLPRDTLLDWGADLEVPAAIGDHDRLATAIEADRAVLRQRLAQLVARPEVREAIFLASPGLEASIDGWHADPTSDAAQNTERSLVRYVSRMAARATPFGLFAGNTVGTLGETTELALAPRQHYRRHTRIDGDYLASLCDALAADPAIRARLIYRPNSSLYQFAGPLRYAMRREGRGGAGRRYPLIGLEPFDELVATLARAQHGARPAELAAALEDPDATGFIAALIDRQVLVADLAPLITGPDAIDDVQAQLATMPDVAVAATAVRALHAIRAQLRQLDRSLGHPAAAYRRAAETLAALPTAPAIDRLFQVNLVPVAVRAQLGTDVVDELLRGVELLRRISPPPRPSELTRFRDAFVERYDQREIPLVEALDEESGIGFDAASRAAAPLLHGLEFPAPGDDDSVAWPRRLMPLLRRVAGAIAAAATEVVLDEAELEAMAAPTPAALPDAMQALVVVARPADGETRIAFQLIGPPGAAMLGRFCHDDAAMQDVAAANIAAEQALRPGVLFAEIAHLPDGRLANITARPVMRSHEIVYLGRSGAPPERQIAMTDLLVSVRDGRVVLRARSLGREVVPRLTNMHDVGPGALATYRFLASLQNQGVAVPRFPLGPLAELPFLPRIRCGHIVLAPARWTLSRAEIDPVVTADGADRVRALARLRKLMRLPRWICVHERDNVLPVDLDNVLAVDSFALLIKSQTTVVVTELWPAPSELLVTGPDGRYASELVIPLVRVAASEPPAGVAPAPVSTLLRPARSIPRSFAPGSEWLYAKLYTGHTTADRVLTDAITEIVHDCPAWFFLRYADPHAHLRVRVRGEPAWLAGEVMPRLEAATRDMLADGRIWRIQLDTYEREVERYGGPVGIELAERLFAADSAYVLDVIRMLDDEAEPDLRWRLVLRGIDQLLEDLGLDLAARLAVLRHTRDGFAREHGADRSVALQRGLGDRYRRDRVALEALLDRSRDAGGDLAPALERLADRSRANAPIVDELRAAADRGALALSLAELAPSYVHMHVNRMIRSAARAHELVLYDLLVRLYESQRARARHSPR